MNISNYRFTDRRITWIFFLLGGLPATIFAMEKGYVFFYQTFTPESVMWACGLGMVHPGEVLEALSQFTYGKTRVLDCAVLDNLQSPGPVGFFAKTQPYFTWPAAVLWRIFGLNYYAMLPLVYALYAFFSAGIFTLSRLFLGKKLAVFAAMLICLAPISVGMSLYLRDFSKAPFFIWAIVFLIQAIREKQFAMSMVYSIASAVVIGIGFGFRADLIVLFPVGIVILAIGVRPVWKTTGRPMWFAGLLAPTVFLAAGIISSAPVWLQMNIGSSGGSAIIQGASEHFRVSSGLTSAGYAVGWAYSDEMTLSGVAARERPKRPDWDKNEPEPLQGASQAQKLSTKNLLSWADIFAADFFAQSLKSAGWILGMPAYYKRAKLELRYAKTNAKGRYLSAKTALSVYYILGQFWIPFVGAFGALILIWRRFLISGREALCITLLFGFLITYPALQFSARHLFHLEFVWIISVLSLLAVLSDDPFAPEKRRQFLTYLAGFTVAIAGAYGTAIWWQKKTITFEVANLLSLPKEAVESGRHVLASGDVFYKVSVPQGHRELVASASDAMTPKIRYKGIQWNVRAAADRLVIQLEGENCEPNDRTVQARYYHSADIWQPFDTEHYLETDPNSAVSTALFPAFYRPTQHFAGVLVPKKYAGCEVKIERIIGESRLPLVMTANVETTGTGGKIVGSNIKWPGGFGAETDVTSVTRKIMLPKKDDKNPESELKALLAN